MMYAVVDFNVYSLWVEQSVAFFICNSESYCWCTWLLQVGEIYFMMFANGIKFMQLSVHSY